MSNAVQKIEIEPIAAPATPMEMLATALANGSSVEVLNGLMALQERWEKNQARKAFDNAIAAAKGEIGPIVKNKVVDFTSQKGRTNYRHEDLAEIARSVDPIMKRHGLSYRYRADQNGQKVRVTCIVSHRDGYYEETSLEAGEDHTGNKNAIQAIGSTATFLQRYTLKLALGLAATADDDARSAAAADTITEEQVETLRAKLDETDADIPAFCAYFKIAKFDDLPARDFDRAMKALTAKVRK